MTKTKLEDWEEDADLESSDVLYSHIVPFSEKPCRVDKYLSELPELSSVYSRAYLKSLIDEGRLSVNNKVVKGSFKIQPEIELQLLIPPIKEAEILPENIPLSIIYEDDDVLLINKPKNMVVHPANSHYTGTLVNGLMYYLKDNLSGINGVQRPGIVHRIDKDTTGILVVCKNDQAHRFLSEQLKEHSIQRKYIALVHGWLKEDGKVDAPIGRHPYDRKKMSIHSKNGKKAVTHYHILEQYRLRNGNLYTLVECQLETGRTHQIRVHLSSIHHPIVGDEVYGTGKNPFHLKGQTLHAGLLGFLHPSTKEYVEFKAELPDYFKDLLKKLDTMRE